MNSWSDWISAGLSGWVVKAAISLGFGSVAYTGWEFMKSQLDAEIANFVGSIPASMYALLSLGGFIEAIGIWLGALTLAVTLLAFKRFSFLGS